MINKVILVGRLGNEPTKKQAGSNNVTNFSLATSEKYKDKQGVKHEVTDWHNIVIWGAQADIAEKYLKKGSLIYLEGRLKSRSWEDKDGVKKYTTEVNVDTFKMLDSQSNSNNSDDLPF